jgi:hypothetical protein
LHWMTEMPQHLTNSPIELDLESCFKSQIMMDMLEYNFCMNLMVILHTGHEQNQRRRRAHVPFWPSLRLSGIFWEFLIVFLINFESARAEH